jgi:hypothetical protein
MVYMLWLSLLPIPPSGQSDCALPTTQALVLALDQGAEVRALHVMLYWGHLSGISGFYLTEGDGSLGLLYTDAPTSIVQPLIVALKASNDLAVAPGQAWISLPSMERSLDWTSLHSLLSLDQQLNQRSSMVILAEEDAALSDIYSIFNMARAMGYSHINFGFSPPLALPSAPAFPATTRIEAPQEVEIQLDGSLIVDNKTISSDMILGFEEYCTAETCLVLAVLMDGARIAIATRLPSQDPLNASLFGKPVQQLASPRALLPPQSSGSLLPIAYQETVKLATPPSTPTILPTPPVILGALPKEEIDAVIKKALPAVKKCYESSLALSPALQGKVVVKFVIAADGSVSSSEIKSSTLNGVGVDSFQQCLLGVFSRLRFPKPAGGGIVIVNYPLVFAQE